MAFKKYWSPIREIHQKSGVPIREIREKSESRPSAKLNPREIFEFRGRRHPRNLIPAKFNPIKVSKAFDSLNHELLIAKLNAYNFDDSVLKLLLNYFDNRKQYAKINNELSTWKEIKSGVSQGSILGPLLFNIYINDLFYFIDNASIANYADDNTPYLTNESIEILIRNLEIEINTLNNWFKSNYLSSNDDKNKLLVTNSNPVYKCEIIRYNARQ